MEPLKDCQLLAQSQILQGEVASLFEHRVQTDIEQQQVPHARSVRLEAEKSTESFKMRFWRRRTILSIAGDGVGS
jgi:hypothetical protein